MDCLFCKIIAGEIPSDKVYEDDMVYAFKDIEPVAPVHYLIIPKEHISGASAVNSENSKYVAHIFEVAAKIAADEGFADGYRAVSYTHLVMLPEPGYTLTLATECFLLPVP